MADTSPRPNDNACTTHQQLEQGGGGGGRSAYRIRTPVQPQRSKKVITILNGSHETRGQSSQ